MQKTVFGQAEVVTYMKVERKAGGVGYYKIVGGQQIAISEQEYKENN